MWNLLRNPKYAGLGRNLRFATSWGTFQDRETGDVEEGRELTDRLRDPEQWSTETYAVAEGAIPPIVSREQFVRVQTKLAALKKQNNRGGPRRDDQAAHSTLLDGGYVRCAHCGGKLTRYWDRRGVRPMYQCGKRAGTPLAGCRPHQIDAVRTDRLALWLLAKALTDPEDLLRLADAAAARHAEAEAEAGLADAALTAYSQEVARLDTQAEQVRTALRALADVPGVEAQVAGLREQLARIAKDREAAVADHAHAIPRRERTRDRQEFLRKVFTVRDEVVNWQTGTVGEDGEPHLHIGEELTVQRVAALLGVSEAAVRRSKLPKIPVWEYDGDEGGGAGEGEPDDVLVSTRYVVYLMLKRASREQVRTLLRNVEAVVTVSRPRTRAEWATLGPTPVADRVQLQLLDEVAVRTDAANVSRFS